MNRKGWFVRFLILGAIATILIIKIYLLVYVLLFVGIYSFLTTLLLFSIFVLSYFKYRDPFNNAKDLILSSNHIPLVSIVVAAKNEQENIRNCVESCINSTYQNREIIIVNDGSTDRTTEILKQMQIENGSKIRVIHLPRNIGKKQAIEHATKITKGEIYAFMDSDCDMHSDAIEKAVKIFLSDRNIGALATYARVRDVDKGTLLEKMQDVWADGQFRLLKGMESSYNSVTCCSGSLSFFRRDAIQPFMYEWAHDRFLGLENFKYATDRRLTAHVLGTETTTPSVNVYLQNNTYNKDNTQILHNIKISPKNNGGSGPLDQYANGSSKTERRNYWKVMYSYSVRVNMGVPKTFRALILQQVRWRKSFIRSVFATGKIYWRRPLVAAVVYYLSIGMKLVRPFIVISTLFIMPFLGDYLTPVFYFSGILFVGMIYAVDFKLSNPNNDLWIYRPLMTLLSTFVYVWLIFYALITIKKKTKWRD
jgi:hyaluronan synthase